MCANFWMQHQPFIGAVVVARLVEQLLQTQNIHGSNPVIGKFYLLTTVLKI